MLTVELNSQINVSTMLYGQIKKGIFFPEERHSSFLNHSCIVEAVQRHFLSVADKGTCWFNTCRNLENVVK